MEGTLCLAGLLEVDIELFSPRDGFVEEDFRQAICLGQN